MHARPVYPPPATLAELNTADAANARADTTRELCRIQRKLDRWELQHLRQLAADLAERLEASERRVAELEGRTQEAETPSTGLPMHLVPCAGPMRPDVHDHVEGTGRGFAHGVRTEFLDAVEGQIDAPNWIPIGGARNNTTCGWAVIYGEGFRL